MTPFTRQRLSSMLQGAHENCAELALLADMERTRPSFTDTMDLRQMEIARQLEALAKEQGELLEGFEAMLNPPEKKSDVL